MIAQLRNQYSTERPPLNELLNGSSPDPTPSKQQQPKQQEISQSKISSIHQSNNYVNYSSNNNNNINNNNNKQTNSRINSNTNNNSNNIDDEGEFIEVKRPRKRFKSYLSNFFITY